MSRRIGPGPLIIATHNRGKLEEFAALLKPWGMSPIPAADLGLPSPEETEDTFLGNARIKAQAAAIACNAPALADDSGLCVDALGGAPGVRTADWAETATGRDFQQAMWRTWQAMEDVDAPYPRLAHFVCGLVLAWPDGQEVAFEGALNGRLIWPMRGADGHGYDPMFVPDGEERTLAEMPLEVKNRISHRAKAVHRLAGACFT